MVQRHFALGMVGGNHFPAELVDLEILAGALAVIGFRPGVTPRHRNHGKHHAGKQSANHTLVYNRECTTATARNKLACGARLPCSQARNRR